MQALACSPGPRNAGAIHFSEWEASPGYSDAYVKKSQNQSGYVFLFGQDLIMQPRLVWIMQIRMALNSWRSTGIKGVVLNAF